MRAYIPLTGPLAKLRGRKMREQLRSGVALRTVANQFKTIQSTVERDIKH